MEHESQPEAKFSSSDGTTSILSRTVKLFQVNNVQIPSRTVEILHQFERDQSFLKDDCANQTNSVPLTITEDEEGWMALTKPQNQNIAPSKKTNGYRKGLKANKIPLQTPFKISNVFGKKEGLKIL